jgi:uncharacterized protein (TIGR03083 family)
VADRPGVEALIGALRPSTEHLRNVVQPLDDTAIDGPAYPAEWSIAHVMAHVGSGAEIMHCRIDDALDGRETPDTFAPSVWERWNAKSARAQVDDGLGADRGLLERIESVHSSPPTDLRFALGPLTMGFAEFVGLRVNEHAFHTWDVEVALDPTAALQAETVPLVVDRLELIARFTARPTGVVRTVAVATAAPDRRFTVDLAADTVTFAAGGDGRADLELPAEAWARLVYGRLDPDHTPEVTDPGDALDLLRRVFPGP